MCNLSLFLFVSSAFSHKSMHSQTHTTAPTHSCSTNPERQSGGGLRCDSFASLADGSDLRITAVCSFLILLVVNLKMFSLMVFWQRPCRGNSGQLTSPASCSAQAGPSGAFSPPSFIFKKTTPLCSLPYLHLALQIRFHMHQCLRVGALTHRPLIFSDCSECCWVVWWVQTGGIEF